MVEVGDEIFISYINDNNNTWNGYVTLISFDDNFITFNSGSSEIIIPVSRILKIKKKGVDDGKS